MGATPWARLAALATQAWTNCSQKRSLPQRGSYKHCQPRVQRSALEANCVITCSRPLLGMVPPVGLYELTPTVVAGHTMEPQVSLPIAKGNRPARQTAPQAAIMCLEHVLPSSLDPGPQARSTVALTLHSTQSGGKLDWRPLCESVANALMP